MRKNNKKPFYVTVVDVPPYIEFRFCDKDHQTDTSCSGKQHEIHREDLKHSPKRKVGEGGS